MKPLLQLAKGEVELQSVSHRLLIQGCAGTGKSQAIKIITRLTRRLFKKNLSVLNLAPTGSASVIIPEGRTIHSVVNIPSQGKEFAKLSMNEQKMNVKSLKTLKSFTVDEHNKLVLRCINADEYGMYGQHLMAWFNQRFVELSEVLHPGIDAGIFGVIPCFNLSGDLYQLSPVGDTVIYKPLCTSAKPSTVAGYAAYKSFTDVIVLDQVVRQDPSQAMLKATLNNLRVGEVCEDDCKFVNNRALSRLSPEEKYNYDPNNPSLIWLTETWDEANKHNYEVIASLNSPVAMIKSLSKGRHSSKRELGQIWDRSIICVGCRVILTKNEGSLTWAKLNNGAIGTVISIVYKEGISPPDFPEYIVVDFKNYDGPPWIQAHPTWIPVTKMTVRDEDNCCWRTGFPLIPGYGISIHKSQGMSIGDNELITHAVIKLSHNITMEAKSLGLAYTALSRVCAEKNFALAEPISYERLSYVNTHPQMKNRRNEERRLIGLAQKTYEKYSCSEEEYIDLIEQIDDHCDDGIRDCAR